MTIRAFNGAKLALLCEDRVLAYKRDHTANIPYPGRWDLPGGGREGDESPVACVLRELDEEFGLRLPPSRLTWSREYPGKSPDALVSHFFAGSISPGEITAIRFGDEGERWEMMEIERYLYHPEGIPHLQRQLRDYLSARS